MLVTVVLSPAEKAHEVGVVAAASQTRPTFEQLVADLLDEMAVAMPKQGPLMIEKTIVSVNVSSDMRKRLHYLVSRELLKAKIEEVACIACDDVVRSRIEGGTWILEVGNAREKARSLNAKGMLTVSLDYTERQVTLDARIVSPRDASVVWAKRFVSNEDRALLDRDPSKLQTIEEREKELLDAERYKPMFGHAVFLGLVNIPFDVGGISKGSINGLTFGYRLYEVFGKERDILVGVQLRAFVDPNASNLPFQLPAGMPVSGGFVTLVGCYTLTFKDQRLPLFRAGAEIGGYFSGSLGNNAVFGGLIEMMMRFRLGFNFALLYTNVSDLTQQLQGTPLKVGGLTYVVGTSFNWD